MRRLVAFVSMASLIVMPFAVAGCGCGSGVTNGDNPAAKDARPKDDPEIAAKKAERAAARGQ